MVNIGKIALAVWAAGIAYVGYLLVAGQSAVLINAAGAGRWSEALMQGLFITLVAVGTVIAVGLFIFVGVLRE